MLVLAPLVVGTAAAQNGLSNGRFGAPRQGEPEFQMGLMGSRTGSSGSQATGGGFFVGIRLPVKPWLFAEFQTGHLYRVSATESACQCDPPPPPATGVFTRTSTELTETRPLAVPTGFFATRLSAQLGRGTGTQLRLQAGIRHRNASHTWLPTAGLALKLASRSTPLLIDVEAARYQLQYRNVEEQFQDGVLTTRTTSPSALAPVRGIELVARVGFALGSTPRAGRGRGR